MTAPSALDTLAERFGIESRYVDIAGNEQVTGRDSKLALLRAMGVDVDGEAGARAALEDPSALPVPPREIIARPGQPVEVPVGDGAVRWRLELQGGDRLGGDAEGRLRLNVPEAGVHALRTEGRAGTEDWTLLAAPAAVPTAADLGLRPPVWGVTAALYGLRSGRNLGVGDYADLADAAAATAPLGADFFGINPVHALISSDPAGFSPYSPSHRGFLNAAHIAVDHVPGFATCAAARRRMSESGAAPAALRSAELIDYRAVAPLRAALLEMLFEHFEARAGGRQRRDFETFVARRGDPLASFALFEAIAERHGPGWPDWPAELQDSSGPAVRAFARSQAPRVRYHAWLQWLADAQLGAAQSAARTAGMALGLYLDIAVGVRPDGAEVWADRSGFARGAALGAPPDRFNAAGQNWGLAPFSPLALRQQRYHAFAETLRAAMRHAGMIRIDHVLGFNRSFWMPADGTAGGYVRYPLDALLAVTAIEAARAKCLVVGEDLGVVPPGFRERLAAAGIYGCSVFQFEREPDGSVRPPDRYREATLASLGTHDLPTLRGYWAGRDIECRRDAGQIDAAAAGAERKRRDEDRRQIVRALGNQGLLAGGEDAADEPDAVIVDELAVALHAFLARTPAALRGVQLDDALGVAEQQNMPGTVDEYPNWRQRLPVTVAALADQPLLRRIAAALGGRAAAAGKHAERGSGKCR